MPRNTHLTRERIFKQFVRESTDPNSGTEGRDGFVDYNNTVAGVDVAADTWHTLPNNGAGAFSNLAYAPPGVTNLINTSSGAIEPYTLNLGDTIFIRSDFTVIPTIHEARLEFRYTLGTGAGAYTLPTRSYRLLEGAGRPDRIVSDSFHIYMGDTNTRDNPIYLQIKCSADFNVFNAGAAIAILRR